MVKAAGVAVAVVTRTQIRGQGTVQTGRGPLEQRTGGQAGRWGGEGSGDIHQSGHGNKEGTEVVGVGY